ncbi:slr1659 superfamily regulator [Spirulina sp. 06S082]|uniref:slr1659 superfamily regulator n=1 Tax=Spirulina sp. 06S082 TaxID=3110248 RepID=UPI002B1FFB4A|nr:hypothetical protein [Spirulina sp. 06S082]MEA5471467.1 hypothetical protein [Spirulina sp. 06S082]
MEIKTETYGINYDESTMTICFEGSLRLSGMDEYMPIVELLRDIAQKTPPHITLNLRELKFLNSAGINVLSKFTIEVRKNKAIAMTVQGAKNVPWQGKSLKNLQRLMPALELEWE